MLQHIHVVFASGVQTGKLTANPAAHLAGVLTQRKVTHRPACIMTTCPSS